MAAYNSVTSKLWNKYGQLNTIPSIISVAFVVAAAYTFGGIAAIEVNWFGGYVLSTEHALLVSLATYAVGFASSDTKQWRNYAPVEQGLIALGPALMLVYHYDLFLEYITWTTNLELIAFGVTLVGWTVAAR